MKKVLCIILSIIVLFALAGPLSDTKSPTIKIFTDSTADIPYRFTLKYFFLPAHICCMAPKKDISFLYNPYRLTAN